jgi:lycopene beta-cyclase
MPYDYIMAGGGCAGLSLAVRMVQSAALQSKSILIIDRERKTRNDRTWCFWEQQPDLFEPVVHRAWQHLWFHSEGFSKKLAIAPYAYKMIRGLDFYNFCYGILEAHPRVQFFCGSVDQIHQQPGLATVTAGGQAFEGEYVFNSILPAAPRLHPKHHYLKQHFKGWFVETARPFFRPSEPTLMDFRVSQAHGTAFVYVMPLSDTEALIEYTLFTKDLLAGEEYDYALRDYLKTWLQLPDYRIREEEFGVIPMTDYPFEAPDRRIISVGTAGGATKASSGYTFRYIQKQTAALVQQIERTGVPASTRSFFDRRFRWYDATLLNILSKGKPEGHRIFTWLFQRGNPQRLLKFLDNETHLLEELHVMQRLPRWAFSRAGLEELFK